MILFLIILILIFLSLLINIIFWRIRLPNKQTISIFIIFIAVFLFFCLIHFLNFLPKNYTLKYFGEWIQIILFYFTFLFTYLIVYTSIENNSPSMKIIMQIYNSGKKGLNNSELNKVISNEEFIKTRIDSLLRSDLLLYRDNIFLISPKGKSTIKIMLLIHKLIDQKKISS